MRRLIDGGKNDTFEHQRFDVATQKWQAGGTIPADPGLEATGISLVTNGKAMLLFAIGSDAAHSIRVTRWDGSAWSAWSTVFGATAARTDLNGTGCRSKTHAAITWMEGTGTGPYQVVAADVAALF